MAAKWTMPGLRRAVWKFLHRKDLEIVVADRPIREGGRPVSGRMRFDEDPDTGEWTNPTITVDPGQADLGSVLVHEALHYLLDSVFVPVATYDVYETWITSLEKPFFKTMTPQNPWAPDPIHASIYFSSIILDHFFGFWCRYLSFRILIPKKILFSHKPLQSCAPRVSEVNEKKLNVGTNS